MKKETIQKLAEKINGTEKKNTTKDVVKCAKATEIITGLSRLESKIRG